MWLQQKVGLHIWFLNLSSINNLREWCSIAFFWICHIVVTRAWQWFWHTKHVIYLQNGNDDFLGVWIYVIVTTRGMLTLLDLWIIIFKHKGMLVSCSFFNLSHGCNKPKAMFFNARLIICALNGNDNDSLLLQFVVWLQQKAC